MNSQVEKEIEDHNIRIKKINTHIKNNKKDHSAKIALMKTVAKLRSTKKYLVRIKKKQSNTNQYAS